MSVGIFLALSFSGLSFYVIMATARICKLFFRPGGGGCSFAGSCPNAGKAGCQLVDIEDIVAGGAAGRGCSALKAGKRPYSVRVEVSQTDAPPKLVTPEAVPSCYQKPLEEAHPSLVPFNSTAGREMFGNALGSGMLNGSYWNLAENYTTQSEPAFCALTSLCMALNSLGVDPKRRAWPDDLRVPWRWFTETSLLGCCDKHSGLERIRRDGLPLHEVARLASCNAKYVEQRYAASSESVCGLAAAMEQNGVVTGHGVEDSRNLHTGLILEEDELRKDILRVCAEVDSAHAFEQPNTAGSRQRMIASFSRASLGQTGEHGHFSCVGAYDDQNDMALVMDVARFKYFPFWAPVGLLFEAMKPFDSDSKLPRGYLVVSNSDKHASLPHAAA